MKRPKYFLKFLHVANIQAAVNGQRTGARLDWVQFVGSKNNICLCVFDIYAFGEFFLPKTDKIGARAVTTKPCVLNLCVIYC